MKLQIWKKLGLAAMASSSLMADAQTLSYSLGSGSLVLEWPSGHLGRRLEEQTNSLAASNWFAVPGSATTNRMVIPLSGDTPISVFYRMVYS
jgi:hypothetical protein